MMLRAHKPSRLIFAILTLTIALAGVVANFSLASAAMQAFSSQLELSNRSTYLLRGTLSDAKATSYGRLDPGAFEVELASQLKAVLPPEFQVHLLRVSQTQITTPSGSRPVTLVEATRDFMAAIDARPLPDMAWNRSGRRCLMGDALASRLPEVLGDEVFLDGRKCVVVGSFNLPEAPPFSSFADAIFVSGNLADLAVGVRLRWNIFLTGPVDVLSEETLRLRLGTLVDMSWVDLWSGDALAAQAHRLVQIVRFLSNGLATVILLIGASSIGSLMSFSVTERAREIAVRRTIGATRTQIVVEILKEALLIGVIASGFGLLLGYQLATYLQAPIAEFFPVPFYVVGSADAIAKSALGFFAICGLCGVIPAMRAASRDPAQVLRNN